MQTPVETLLCPVDFSEPCREAVRAANFLALSFSAEVVLLHVVEPILMGHPQTGAILMDLRAVQEKVLEEAELRLGRMAEEDLPPDLPHRLLVEEGVPARTIDEAARREKAGLIVMATHGRSGWRRFLFGSVADKVIRTTCIPVLAIPPPEGCET